MKYYSIKILKNNIVWLFVDSKGQGILVDCGESKPVLEFLKKHGIDLKYILVTHYHYDHVDGILDVALKTKAKVVGVKKQGKEEIIDIFVKDGDEINLLGENIQIMNVKAHSDCDSIYYFRDKKFLITGDIIFSLGVGKIFEGSIQEMFKIIYKIRGMDKDILIFCGHDLLNANFLFARDLLNVDYSLKKSCIQNKILDLPLKFGEEILINPIFNYDNKFLKEKIGLINGDDFSVLKSLREKKDKI